MEVVRCVQSDSKQQVRFSTYRQASIERSNYSRDFQKFSGLLTFFCLHQTFMVMNYKLQGGDLITFWLIGEALIQPGCNEKPWSPKAFKANQIAWFFYTKFKHHDQHQNQHHDWNLLNKFWLLITFGVLFKVSLKVKLIGFLKFKI